MAKEATRRFVLCTAIALATGVSLGDDVVTAPDARRGSRELVAELPGSLGSTTLLVPRTPASGVALLLFDRDVEPLAPVMDALAASTLLVPIDTSRLTTTSARPCDDIVEQLAQTSRVAQREAGLTTYRPPVLIGTGRATSLARDLVQLGETGVFHGGTGSFAPALTTGDLRCASPVASRRLPRWTTVDATGLPDAAEAALRAPIPPPTTGHLPLDRWLAHFRLPLSAVWAADPRAVAVLMSDAGGLRPADGVLADELAAVGISVLSIDTLRYFWQRRSPRDVAFELKRLLGALESLDLPVLVGGVGFGAETMAVTARFVDDVDLAGLVLVNPGPSAFFEVDPPLPALVSLMRADWSTAEAVVGLAVPTLCLSPSSGRARLLCDELARTAGAAAQQTGAPEGRQEPTDLPVRQIVAFVDAVVAARGQPRKPST